jgi:hypothetical protein
MMMPVKSECRVYDLNWTEGWTDWQSCSKPDVTTDLFVCLSSIHPSIHSSTPFLHHWATPPLK